MALGCLPNNTILKEGIAAKVVVDIAPMIMMQKPTGSSYYSMIRHDCCD
jgi:hypothetical protein